MTGRLIVIEGIDGSGTETQSKLLLEYLKENNPQTEFISFPEYDKPVGRLISDFLFKKLEFDVEMQTLLHVADKVYAKPRIVKWLEEGKTVIADRYITSTMAYQGHMGFPVSGIMKMAEIFGIPKPNDIIFLKISADTSIRRKNKEKQGLKVFLVNKFDAQVVFHLSLSLG